MKTDEHQAQINHIKELLLELPPGARLGAIDDICHNCGRSYVEMNALVCECTGIKSRRIPILGEVNVNEKPNR